VPRSVKRTAPVPADDDAHPEARGDVIGLMRQISSIQADAV
jgi:hypothetical protein